MTEAKKLKGVYACTHCPNIEASEREVACWECGKGEMVWYSRDEVANALWSITGLRLAQAEGPRP